MMKRQVLPFFFLLLSPLYLSAQEINQMSVDEKYGTLILLGNCNRDGFLPEPFAWFEEEYDSYVTDLSALESLPPGSLSGLRITVVLGTWCSDSRREVPRFYKISDELGLAEEAVTLISVDSGKQAPGIDIGPLGIRLVPTFIFYRDEREIGRIVESPVESLEKDLVAILLSN